MEGPWHASCIIWANGPRTGGASSLQVLRPLRRFGPEPNPLRSANGHGLDRSSILCAWEPRFGPPSGMGRGGDEPPWWGRPPSYGPQIDAPLRVDKGSCAPYNLLVAREDNAGRRINPRTTCF